MHQTGLGCCISLKTEACGGYLQHLTRYTAAIELFGAERQDGRGTDQAIPQGCELHEVHDLIHKGCDDFIGLASGTQLCTEEECFSDSCLWGVHIKLLYIATDTSKGGLLLGVTIHHNVPLNDAACKVDGFDIHAITQVHMIDALQTSLGSKTESHLLTCARPVGRSHAGSSNHLQGFQSV